MAEVGAHPGIPRAGLDALEALHTCIAMRYLRPDPIPDDLLRQVLTAATCASSPGNCQGWEFVVVRDTSQRRLLGEAIRSALEPVLPPVPAQGDPSRIRMLAGAHHLLAHFEQAPVVVFVCGAPVYPPANPSAEWIPATLYPAAQNLIVAARALGLGSVFTTYHKPAEARVREILGIPSEVEIAVTIPLGFPARGFRPARRRPLEEVVHRDRW
jgi:nitroreductase